MLKNDIDWGSAELNPRMRGLLEKAIESPETLEQAVKSLERAPGKYDDNAEPEGVIHDPNDFHKDYHASTILLVKQIGDYLNKNYPGWAWVIQANEAGRMIDILNHHCHTSMGYRIRMADIINDPRLHCVKMGAGELLERFGFLRIGLRGENLSRLTLLPRDGAGHLIPEISDIKDKKLRTNAEVARKMATGEYRIFEINGKKMLRVKK